MTFSGLESIFQIAWLPIWPVHDRINPGYLLREVLFLPTPPLHCGEYCDCQWCYLVERSKFQPVFPRPSENGPVFLAIQLVNLFLSGSLFPSLFSIEFNTRTWECAEWDFLVIFIEFSIVCWRLRRRWGFAHGSFPASVFKFEIACDKECRKIHRCDHDKKSSCTLRERWSSIEPCLSVLLTLPLPRVINFKFLLQPHQKYYFT